eukprot:m.236012 g.236012  ORF g.236012 m.236012 type:complete len:1451 (+) comp12915_c0_seq1:22-4374(+)
MFAALAARLPRAVPLRQSVARAAVLAQLRPLSTAAPRVSAHTQGRADGPPTGQRKWQNPRRSESSPKDGAARKSSDNGSISVSDFRARVEGLFSNGPANPHALLYALEDCTKARIASTHSMRVQLAETIWARAKETRSELWIDHYNALFGVYASYRQECAVVPMLKEITAAGLAPNEYTHLRLAQIYANSGDVKGAREALDNIKTFRPLREGDFVHLLAANLVVGNHAAVQDILARIKADGLKLSQHTYNRLLSDCAAIRGTDCAVQLVSAMRKDGLTLDDGTFDRLIVAFAIHGQLDQVQQTIEMRANAGFSKRNPAVEFRLFRLGYLGDVSELQSYLAAQSLNIMALPLELLFRTFAFRGDDVSASRLLEFAASKGVPHTRFQRPVFSAYIKAGDAEAAHTLLNKLRIAIHERTLYTNTIRAIAHSPLQADGVVKQLELVESLMRLDRIAPGADVSNAIMSIWATGTPARKVDSARVLKVFEDLPPSQRTTESWHLALTGLARDTECPDALARMQKIVEEMLGAGERLTQATYRILAAGYGLRGDMDGVAKVLLRVREDPDAFPQDPEFFQPLFEHFAASPETVSSLLENINPTPESYHPLFAACAAAADIPRMLELLSQLKKNNLSVDHVIFAHLIRAYKNADQPAAIVTLLQNASLPVMTGDTPRQALESLAAHPVEHIAAAVQAIRAIGLPINRRAYAALCQARQAALGKQADLNALKPIFPEGSVIMDGDDVSRVGTIKGALMTGNPAPISMYLTRLRNDRTVSDRAYEEAMQSIVKETIAHQPKIADQVALLKRVLTPAIDGRVPIDMLINHYIYKVRSWPAVAEIITLLASRHWQPPYLDNVTDMCLAARKAEPALKLLKVLCELKKESWDPRTQIGANIIKTFLPTPGNIEGFFAKCAAAEIPLTPLLIAELARGCIAAQRPDDALAVLARASGTVDVASVLAQVVDARASAKEVLAFARARGLKGAALQGVAVKLLTTTTAEGAPGHSREVTAAIDQAIAEDLLTLNEALMSELITTFLAAKSHSKAIADWLWKKIHDHPALVADDRLVDATSVCLRANRLDGAEKLLKRLRALGNPLGGTLYTDLVLSYAKSDLTAAATLFRQALAEGVHFSSNQRVALTQGLLEHGVAGMALVDELAQSGGKQPVQMRDAILLFHAGRGDVAEAVKVFDGIAADGYSPSDRSYNALLLAHAKAGNVAQAEAVLEQLRAHTASLPSRTIGCNTLLGLYKSKGQVDKALELLAKMTQWKVPCNTRSLQHVFEACAAAGRIADAVTVAKNPPALHDADVTRSGLREVLVHHLIEGGRLQDALVAATQLDGYAPEEPRSSLRNLLRAFLDKGDLNGTEAVMGLVRKLNPVPEDLLRLHATQAWRLAVRARTGVQTIEGHLARLAADGIADPVTLRRMLDIWVGAGEDEAVFRMLADRRRLRIADVVPNRSYE